MDIVGPTIFFSVIAWLVNHSVRTEILAHRARHRDTSFMPAWASQRGWRYVRQSDLSRGQPPLSLFRTFRKGGHRGHWPTIQGPLTLAGRPAQVTCGDFQYLVSLGRQTRTLRLSYLLVKLPLTADAKLRIHRRPAPQRFLRALWALDDSVPAGLDRELSISAPEPLRSEFLGRAAALLADAPKDVQIASGWLCITDGVRCWDAPEFDQRLQWADRFVAAVPPLCFEEAHVRTGTAG